MILVAELKRGEGTYRCARMGRQAHRYTRCKPLERTPLEVITESSKPRDALMNFILEKFEEAGFDLSTCDWPSLRVRLNGHEYLIAEGVGMANAQQIAQALRRVLTMIEQP